MHRNRHIAKHGFRAGGGDGDAEPVPVIAYIAQLAIDGFLLNLNIRHRRLHDGIPVDQAFGAGNQALIKQLHKHLPHRL